MPARLLQNCRDMRRIIHLATLRPSLSVCNDGIRPTADFEFVSVGIFKKERVIPGRVFGANFRTLKVFAAGCADQVCDFVDFSMGVSPERDPRFVGPMIFVFGQPKKLRRFVAAGGIKSVISRAVGSGGRGFVLRLSKSQLRQKFLVKLRARFDVFHTQINVIQQSRLHYFDFRLSRRIINFNPDQVSSTAQTLISTNPRGSATERMTSSEMSVGT